eukprot:TRINITY_DN105193_c0_g1_i1.p1 TRINITY_DN105193_c0_g1~~TRINITY_DN105193_c0_g1_i1.p1  ORF type:complete len:176 (+),score=22.68 TRINITY_DN105193_c0_g1_i1:466-993(+)
MAYNKRRWGGDGWTQSLRRSGARAGAPFSNWKWWPHTLNAHCLVQYADMNGIPSSAAKAAIFHALYEEGINVSEEDALADIAASKLGLNRQAVLEYLQSKQGVQVVIETVQQGQKLVQGGVPFFIVSGSDSSKRPLAFSGAQPPEQFLSIFREVTEENLPQSAESPGDGAGQGCK